MRSSGGLRWRPGGCSGRDSATLPSVPRRGACSRPPSLCSTTAPDRRRMLADRSVGHACRRTAAHLPDRRRGAWPGTTGGTRLTAPPLTGRSVADMRPSAFRRVRTHHPARSCVHAGDGSSPSPRCHDLFVHVALGVERSRTWDLDHIAAPAPFGTVKLDEGSVPSHALPPFERHVLYPAHADPAIDRNPLRLHVVVIRRIRPFPGAIARVLEPFRLMPVVTGDVVHAMSPGQLPKIKPTWPSAADRHAPVHTPGPCARECRGWPVPRRTF